MRSGGGSRAWYVLLLVPFVALLWVPFYTRTTPKLFGFPFFYWSQFARVVATALIVWIVYVATRQPARGPEPELAR